MGASGKRLHVDVQPGSSCCLVRIGGVLDLTSAADLDEKLRTAMAAGLKDFVLDLSDVQLLDSSGARVLFALQQRCRACGGHMQVRNSSVAVRRFVGALQRALSLG
jgi:anti-anti-sigma factor